MLKPITILALLFAFSLTSLQSQLHNKSVSVKNYFSNPTVRDHFPGSTSEPVTIVGVTLNQQPLTSDTGFPASDDWLQDLRITLNNRSDKIVKYVMLNLEFPTIEATGEKTMNLFLGRNYFASPTPESDMPDVTLRSGVSTIIHFNSQDPNNYQKFVEGLQHHNFPLSLFSKVKVYVSAVVFDDNTGWSMGFDLTRRTDDPAKWTKSERKISQSRGKSIPKMFD